MAAAHPATLDSERLPRALQQGLAPLYVVIGAEPLLGFEACDRITAAARKAGYVEREVLTAEQGFDWSRLALAASTDSLFGDRRVLELRIPSGRPGVEGAKALEALASRLGDSTLVLVSLPALERSAGKARWLAALAAAGCVVTAHPVTRERLPAWIQERLAAQDQQVSQDSLLLLAERTEGNLLAAFQEVQKLALLHPPGPIADEAVREAVMDVARFQIDDLTEALLAREPVRFERTLRGLRDSAEALPLIVWSLAEGLRGVARAGQALAEGRPLAQAIREANVWGDRRDMVERHVRRIPPAIARQALQQVAVLDRASKGMAGGADPWDTLLGLGLRLMQDCAAQLG